jgi:hypothetical protein
MSASHVREAFGIVLPDAEESETWYVVLMEEVPYYGGPEEGGWWGRDTVPVAWKECLSKKEATRYEKQVEKLAEELSIVARDRYGNHCLESLEWLEARGLEADFLPEPDGPSTYYVQVSKGIPQPEHGCRHYE